ncbi:hypothetical protein CAPTEDRAFT_93455 [Capitella teleta]|uniref:AAA+ ATPase domain-containing protein n=1 Tax=Capitella teleta TaxID=283909 RepID=R7VKE9_CAPTE|nr:hypothetical protein CAPTEDRAFT_93455 [Capitella teleta]|eukprot:ELU17316.1 hypothetical protein CAPTEDRAFT_93455 [Capitella teleta]
MSAFGLSGGKSSSNGSSSSWIDPSFDFTSEKSSTQASSSAKSSSCKQPIRGLKRSLHSDTQFKTRHRNSDELWCDKYAPCTQADLAVHKKKVEELAFHLNRISSGEPHTPPVVLLTGPCGAGKSAAVKVIAKELNMDIQEWINPLQDDDQFNREDYQKEYSLFGSVTSKSQIQNFREFLLRANKYASLGAATSKRLILVEDFPNVFLRDSGAFKELVRHYCRQGRCPLVFVVSDSQSSESIERSLFPKDFQAELHMTVVAFNPVTTANIVKTLQKILAKEPNVSCSKDELTALAERNSGDVRSAVNGLQFMGWKTKPTSVFSVKKKPALKSARTKLKSSKTSASTKEAKAEIGDKDSSLFLFRALGKVLHCKREETPPTTSTLPPHLCHYQRPELLEMPEEVLHRSHMSGELFTAFIHQNYLSFYTDMDDLQMAAEYLSDADYLTIDWSNRSILRDYASSVATRGLMFSNGAHTNTKASPGWKPLHKPEIFAISKKTSANTLAARQLFRLESQETRELVTQIIPFMGLMRKPLANQQQRSLTRDLVCFYSNSHVRRHLEKLDEKEVASLEADATDERLYEATPHGHPGQEAEDEDCVIDEFDD